MLHLLTKMEDPPNLMPCFQPNSPDTNQPILIFQGSCGYFQFCSQLTCIRPGYPNTYPPCPCRAGTSRLYMDSDSGRFHLGCTVLEGQGACNFIQWLDADSGGHEMGVECCSLGEGPAPPANANGDRRNEWFEQTSLYMSDGPCPTEATTVVGDGKPAATSPSSPSPAEAEVETISLDGDDAMIIDLLLSRLEANSSDSSVCS